MRSRMMSFADARLMFTPTCAFSLDHRTTHICKQIGVIKAVVQDGQSRWRRDPDGRRARASFRLADSHRRGAHAHDWYGHPPEFRIVHATVDTAERRR